MLNRQNINLKLKSISTSLMFKKKSGSPVVFNRNLTTNHSFKCNDLQISNNESSYNKRLISEMVHIRKQKHEFSKITRNYCLSRPSLSLTFCLLSNFFQHPIHSPSYILIPPFFIFCLAFVT